MRECSQTQACQNWGQRPLWCQKRRRRGRLGPDWSEVVGTRCTCRKRPLQWLHHLPLQRFLHSVWCSSSCPQDAKTAAWAPREIPGRGYEIACDTDVAQLLKPLWEVAPAAFLTKGVKVFRLGMVGSRDGKQYWMRPVRAVEVLVPPRVRSGKGGVEVSGGCSQGERTVGCQNLEVPGIKRPQGTW